MIFRFFEYRAGKLIFMENITGYDSSIASPINYTVYKPVPTQLRLNRYYSQVSNKIDNVLFY